jgi:hypothetical protein
MFKAKAGRHILLVLLAAILLIQGPSYIFADKLPKQFPFRKKDALNEWEEKIFKGKVLYTVRVEKTDGYLNALSNSTASGILYRIKFDPKQEPNISWKWKVISFPKKGTPLSKGGDWIEADDYAARFYVIFPRLSFNLTHALEYVWDEKLLKGSIITSPYSKNIKIIVAESGKGNLNKWVYVERNIYNDYVRAFARKPGNVGAIAIMTDTDNTKSTAEAQYDEIRVGYKA